MIAFCDCEMTGLEETQGSILEVAFVITTDQLHEVGRFSTIVRPLFGKDKMDPFVVDMHTKNGLLADIEDNPQCPRRYEAEEKALDFMIQFPQGMPLAGNSVHFDKAWLKYHMPRLHAYFHYRIIDVSSFNEMAARINPTLHAGRPGASKETAHRALADALESLATLRYYKEHGLFL